MTLALARRLGRSALPGRGCRLSRHSRRLALLALAAAMSAGCDGGVYAVGRVVDPQGRPLDASPCAFQAKSRFAHRVPLRPGAPPRPWRALCPGVDYVVINIGPQPTAGSGRLHVVRIDPARATIAPRLAAQVGGEPRTAASWCDNPRVVAVINAGMYDRDLATHVGYLRVGDRVFSPRWVGSYQSVLLLGPHRRGLPAATLRDVRGGDGAASFSGYETVIQNLRLIRGRGINVWPESSRRWSEAAIGLDYLGRILFLFCRAPFTMRDFNEQLARLPLGIVRAMHVEGGPEASLSVRGPDLSLDLAGSYETGFNEGDDNAKQRPLPNVLVVESRLPAS